MNDFCQYLDWDSDFFGYRIARITGHQLNNEVTEAIKQWCNSHNIDCLYFLADAADGNTIRLAEDNDFRLVDIRVTFKRQLQINFDFKTQNMIRFAVSDDTPALRRIARVSHRDTRFYYDENFPTSLTDLLYETWIEKSCNGYADAVLVAELQGQPVGYISCHLTGKTEGQIGLIAVDAKWQGARLGQALVNEAIHWFIMQGATEVSVVTQGRNRSAQRLYQRCGFLTNSVQLWYHRWFTKRAA